MENMQIYASDSTEDTVWRFCASHIHMDALGCSRMMFPMVSQLLEGRSRDFGELRYAFVDQHLQTAAVPPHHNEHVLNVKSIDVESLLDEPLPFQLPRPPFGLVLRAARRQLAVAAGVPSAALKPIDEAAFACEAAKA